MGLYHVQLPEAAKSFLQEHKDTCIIVAQTAAEALLVAKANIHLPSDEAWASATATAMADAADLEGWRAKITIEDSSGDEVETVTVTGASGATADTIGALLVIALNATDSIAGAAYDTGTNVLTIAETTDTLGDSTVTCEFLPPTTWNDPTISFDEFYTSLVHEGVSGAALQVTLVQVATPQLLYQLGSGH
jgi:hypothetical protein